MERGGHGQGGTNGEEGEGVVGGGRGKFGRGEEGGDKRNVRLAVERWPGQKWNAPHSLPRRGQKQRSVPGQGGTPEGRKMPQ